VVQYACYVQRLHQRSTYQHPLRREDQDPRTKTISIRFIYANYPPQYKHEGG
jgi:hypothetical protein